MLGCYLVAVLLVVLVVLACSWLQIAVWLLLVLGLLLLYLVLIPDHPAFAGILSLILLGSSLALLLLVV